MKKNRSLHNVCVARRLSCLLLGVGCGTRSARCADGNAGTTVAGSLRSMLDHLGMPAAYSNQLVDCGVGASPEAVHAASMPVLTGCGLKIGHARRMKAELSADASSTAAVVGSGSCGRVVANTADATVLLPGGARMPFIGLGGGIFDGDAATTTYDALSLGYRLIDTAENYATEAPIGAALSRWMDASPYHRREDVFVTSKVGAVGYREAMASFNRSLAALATEYLDLYLVHAAAKSGVPDPQSPRHAEARLSTWQALIQLKTEGRVRAIGVCNHSPRQLGMLAKHTGVMPEVLQMEWTPLLQRHETVSFCQQHNIVVQGFGNGGGGWRLGQRDHNLDFLHKPIIDQTSARHGVSPVQVSLRWSLQHGLAVIPKARSKVHLLENLRGLFGWELNSSEMEAIDSLHRGASVYRFLDPDTFA